LQINQSVDEIDRYVCAYVIQYSTELVDKLTDGIHQMRQPIRAVETLLSWLNVNLLQFDQSEATNGTSLSTYFC